MHFPEPMAHLPLLHFLTGMVKSQDLLYHSLDRL